MMTRALLEYWYEDRENFLLVQRAKWQAAILLATVDV